MFKSELKYTVLANSTIILQSFCRITNNVGTLFIIVIVNNDDVNFGISVFGFYSCCNRILKSAGVYERSTYSGLHNSVDVKMLM